MFPDEIEQKVMEIAVLKEKEGVLGRRLLEQASCDDVEKAIRTLSESGSVRSTTPTLKGIEGVGTSHLPGGEDDLWTQGKVSLLEELVVQGTGGSDCRRIVFCGPISENDLATELVAAGFAVKVPDEDGLYSLEITEAGLSYLELFD